MSSAPDDGPPLNAAPIIDALNRHQVRYVIVGAFAAEAQGVEM